MRRLATVSLGVACITAIASTCGGPGVSVEPLPGGEPQLRIGLSTGISSASVSGESGVLGLVGNDVVLRSVASELVIARDGNSVAVSGSSADGSYERLVFRSSGGRPIRFNGNAYRGTVETFVGNSGMTVVNVVGLEDYLRGVVGLELGQRPVGEMAAVKAQAVASRTYALKNRGKFRENGFDMAAGVSDQAYAGVAAEYQLGDRAIRETRGQVVTYAGRIISPFFHSTCGYATAWPEEVFGTVSSAAYLRSVSDRNGSGYFCDISPHFRWTVAWKQAELQSMLSRTLTSVLGLASEDVGQVRTLDAARVGASGRVTELRVVMDNGSVPVMGPQVRLVLLRPDGSTLRSNAIQFSEREGDAGHEFVAAGAGYGHGVGMCQWGAIGRARHGQSYTKILTSYFPGTRVERVY